MAQEQRRDPHLLPKILYLEEGKLPDNRRDARPLLHTIQAFYMAEGLLYHMYYDKGLKKHIHQLCLPQAYVKQILILFHDKSAHCNGHTVFENIRTRFYFQNMSTVCTEYAQSCEACQTATPFRRQNRALLHPYDISEMELFGIVHMDILVIDSLANKKNLRYRYCLVIVDHFSKFVRCIPATNCSAKYLAQLFIKNWALDFAVPQKVSLGRLILDNAKYFASAIMTETARVFSLKQTFVSPFRSQSNGAVEIQNKLVTAALRKIVTADPSKWHLAAPYVAFELNSVKKASLGNLSSYEVVFGQSSRSCIDNLLQLKQRPLLKTSVGQGLLASIELVHENVRRHMTRAQQTMKQQYDKGACPPQITAGMTVARKVENLICSPKYFKKLSPKYLGKYIVVKVCDNNTCLLEDAETKELVTRPVPLDKIKPLKPRDIQYQHAINSTPWVKGKDMDNAEIMVHDRERLMDIEPDDDIDQTPQKSSGTATEPVGAPATARPKVIIDPIPDWEEDQPAALDIQLPCDPPSPPVIIAEPAERAAPLPEIQPAQPNEDQPRYWLRARDKSFKYPR